MNPQNLFFSLPQELQIVIFYSPVIITILLLARSINKGIDALRTSQFAWIFTGAVNILFLLRIEFFRNNILLGLSILSIIFCLDFLIFKRLQDKQY